MEISEAVSKATCLTAVARPEGPGVARIGLCGRPAVARFETWAGRLDYACREHAIALLDALAATLDGPDASMVRFANGSLIRIAHSGGPVRGVDDAPPRCPWTDLQRANCPCADCNPPDPD